MAKTRGVYTRRRGQTWNMVERVLIGCWLKAWTSWIQDGVDRHINSQAHEHHTSGERGTPFELDQDVEV